ncbi:FAD-dependent oxidoreductase [Streptomyces sp. TR1341]|uniref:FAD-dependent oxidoreductase n=1 Tax=Streptomyces sp. TR1341 TaxID=2601266 RepID=UPI00138AC145|nr:FAD-dependent oxidoreductase [Streptomyces sp. TR1341]
MTPDAAPVVVVGGGVAGPATALALARRGLPVRLLDRGVPPPDGPAAKAAQLWERPTVPQCGHSHILNSLGVRALRQWAPDVLCTLLEEGAGLLDVTAAAPGAGVRDPELVALAARRNLLDLVLHRAVADEPWATVEYGTTVRGVWLDAARSRVRGVATDRGERIPARLVVDATGRRAASRVWLADAGVQVADDLTATSRLRCFTRFYRLTEPAVEPPGPLNRGNAAGGIFDHYAAVVHPADNGVFAVSIGVLPRDAPTDALHRPAAFTAAARLTPHLAAWTDPRHATPMTGVRPIGVLPNALRGTVRRGPHQVAGLYPVGDAACVTDPLYGRGLSLALQHAFRLADLLVAHPRVDRTQTEEAVRLVDRVLRPWYEQSVHDVRARALLWSARADGLEPPAQPPAAPGRPSLAEAGRAAAHDPAVWHSMIRFLMGLRTPAEVFDSAAFCAGVRAGADRPPAGPPPPSRQELVRALAAAGED